MKNLVIIIILILISSLAYAEDWFPILGWGIRNETAFLDSIKSWNGNSLKTHNTSNIDSILSYADTCTLKCIVQGLVAPTASISLTDMARGQYSQFESEAHDSAYFPPGFFDAAFCSGYAVLDTPLASNDTAWAIDTLHSGTSCYIQKQLYACGHRQEFLNYPGRDSLVYRARFYLRLPDTSGCVQTDTVCSLTVRSRSKDTTLVKRILRVQDFTDSPVSYDTFEVKFTKKAHGEKSKILMKPKPMHILVSWISIYIGMQNTHSTQTGWKCGM